MSESPITPRVLHVNDQRGWRGGEQQMLYLTKGLTERSIRTMAVLQPGGPAVERARAAGVEVCELPMHGEIDALAAFRLARIARDGNFNILHSHTAHSHALILAAAHLFRAPAKVVVHRRTEFPVGEAFFGLARLKYRFGVDLYIAISNHVKEVLMGAGVPEWKIYPVHSSTDPARFMGTGPDPGLRASLGIPDDAFVVGNIAALVRHKDPYTLLEACRIVRDNIPNTWVLHLGKGPLRDRVLAKAKTLHMADRLVLAGFRWDVPELIRVFDIFALSSIQEGMCSTLVEVAASGCPIVATNAGGVSEAVLPGKTGIIVPVRSPRALAEGILELARNPEKAQRLVKRGQARVLDYLNADVLTERTMAVYDVLLSGKVSPARPGGWLSE